VVANNGICGHEVKSGRKWRNFKIGSIFVNLHQIIIVFLEARATYRRCRMTLRTGSRVKSEQEGVPSPVLQSDNSFHV
jgi:hypothetical protein